MDVCHGEGDCWTQLRVHGKQTPRQRLSASQFAGNASPKVSEGADRQRPTRRDGGTKHRPNCGVQNGKTSETISWALSRHDAHTLHAIPRHLWGESFPCGQRSATFRIEATVGLIKRQSHRKPCTPLRPQPEYRTSHTQTQTTGHRYTFWMRGRLRGAEEGEWDADDDGPRGGERPQRHRAAGRDAQRNEMGNEKVR